MNYTEGTWKYEGDGIITDEDGKQIASVFPRDRLANAQLISAAPDMYEALKALLDDAHYNATTRTWSIGPFNEHPFGRLVAGRKAVAKAEGEQE